MQTYTHYVMTALINQHLNKRSAVDPSATDSATDPATAGPATALPPLRSGWLLLGSIMPDVPLILIFFGTFAADLLAGNAIDPGNEGAVESYTGYLFRYAFFEDPWVKAAHNLFHAPLPILFYIALGYWLWKGHRESERQATVHRRGQWGAALFWFGCACALHTAIDIPVHYDDGPLIFFPFDWETRVYGPISYWEQGRGGEWFVIVEHLFLLGMLIYWGITWQKGRNRRRVDLAQNRAGQEQ